MKFPLGVILHFLSIGVGKQRDYSSKQSWIAPLHFNSWKQPFGYKVCIHQVCSPIPQAIPYYVIIKFAYILLVPDLAHKQFLETTSLAIVPNPAHYKNVVHGNYCLGFNVTKSNLISNYTDLTGLT